MHDQGTGVRLVATGCGQSHKKGVRTSDKSHRKGVRSKVTRVTRGHNNQECVENRRETTGRRKVRMMGMYEEQRGMMREKRRIVRSVQPSAHK